QTEETNNAAADLASSIENITTKVGTMNDMSAKQEADHKDGMTQMDNLQSASETASTQTEKASSTVNELSNHVQNIETVLANIEGISEQ
ncbi:hypothetical protein D7Z54_35530, partial [Salibacterium salarium]